MKEQVEIVMATYNGEKYIKEQLDSLLSQSHPGNKSLLLTYLQPPKLIVFKAYPG